MMKYNKVKVNSMRAWLLASRPRTLTAAAVPVMVGTALAIKDTGGDISVTPAVLCFLFAFVMQIDANLINDYCDFIKGNDNETRLGPLRACAQGWVTLGAMRAGIMATTALACVIGLPLIYYGGINMVFIGALCVVFCFLYTTWLSYKGLGDALVLVFFGIVPVMVTYYLEIPSVMPPATYESFLASVTCGVAIDALLVINNYRDIDNDKAAGKTTLVVMLGARLTRIFYLLIGIAVCLTGVVFALNGSLWATILPLVYLALHIKAYRKIVRIGKGAELNAVLADTARNIFIYGILLSIGLLL